MQVGEGGVERGEVHGAGGGGDGDGFGQAQEPGCAAQGVVGVGAADHLDGAVAFAGEEEGDLVGLGAAGGEEGVGGGVAGIDLGGEGAGDERFEGGGCGGLIPGVHRGVEGRCGEVGGGGEGEGRAVEVCGAEGVGGVGCALGDGVDEGAEGFFGAGAGAWEYRVDGFAYAGRGVFRPPGREGPAAGDGSVVQRVEHGGQQRAQGGGACGAAGEGRGVHAGCRPSGARGQTHQLDRGSGGAAAQHNELNPKVVLRGGGGKLARVGVL